MKPRNVVMSRRSDIVKNAERQVELEAKVDQFIERLASYEGSPTVFNPWRDYEPTLDISEEAPAIRRDQLRQYLVARLGGCPYVIIAEAMGYQGGRFSGIAITCERMLLGFHDEIESSMILPHGEGQRTSLATSPLITKAKVRKEGFNEPTDTVVWTTLLDNEINPYEALLWNIFPFHPHEAENLLSNRTPTEAELAIGGTFAKELLVLNNLALYGQVELAQALGSAATEEMPNSSVFAVGRKAYGVLEEQRIFSYSLRHPANGGAQQYRDQFAEIYSFLPNRA